ncbi:MAG: hypothetical protein EBQ46_02075, partial [Actinobacteria bacterium]|nr:hypothetical protein [Actinomycetota bacterium]
MRPDHPYSTTNAARAYSFAVNNQLPAVLTNQVRMKEASDGPIADLLDASRKLVLLSDASVERGNNQGYLKDSDQMYQLAQQIAQAAGAINGQHLLETTALWADMAS